MNSKAGPTEIARTTISARHHGLVSTIQNKYDIQLRVHTAKLGVGP
jgi:hypothetical protein